MSEANAQQDLKAIFREIDKDKDGFINRADLEATPYALSIFEANDNALVGFNKLNNKMDQKDFILLANAYRLKLHQFAIAKFEVSNILKKYLSVSAPGEAGPSLKQSYLKLTAHVDQLQKDKLHSIGLQVGVDKSSQQKKIEQLTAVLGHKPHQIFVLLKFKTNSNGEDIAKKINKIFNDILGIARELAPELEQFVNMFKIYTKYGKGYTYLVAQIDNPFIDNLVSFFNEVIQAISPQCILKFKATLSSSVKNILKQSFSYQNSGGEILAELDIDNVTLKKIKEIMGDHVNVAQGKQTPLPQLLSLLFQELKLTLQFDNLGQALQSTLQIDSFPTPFSQLSTIKQLNLKETISELSTGFAGFIDEIKNSCEAQGEFSLNFHDFFAKITFNIDVEDAFDLL